MKITDTDIAEAVLRTFVKEYDSWENFESRRRLIPPNYEKLGQRMFEVYKTAKRYGF